MDKNLDYYIFGKGGTLMPLDCSNFDLNGSSAVHNFILKQDNPQDQWITYNKTTRGIKNISKEEYEKVERKFDYENQLQNLKKESFTLIECLLYLIARFRLWKNNMKSEVKNDFKNRHGDSNAFYLSISTYQSIIKDNSNNWFEGKSYSTGCKIKNNFI